MMVNGKTDVKKAQKNGVLSGKYHFFALPLGQNFHKLLITKT
jgi:hypothetical protein